MLHYWSHNFATDFKSKLQFLASNCDQLKMLHQWDDGVIFTNF